MIENFRLAPLPVGFEKLLYYRFGEILVVYILVVFGKIGHPGFYRFYPLGYQLFTVRGEILRYSGEIGPNKEGAVVEGSVLGEFKSAAGDLSPLHEDIVPPGGLGVYSKVSYCTGNNPVVSALVVGSAAGHKGKVGITKILVYRASPALTACEFYSVLLHRLQVALPPRILVAAYNNGVYIPPEKEDML